jgi:CRP-like cAMP-binding protein
MSSATDVQARGHADRKQRDVPRPQPVRCLAPGEILFGIGDPRGGLYRVERGALCHYTRSHGRHEIIEFVFPGDVIGFGHIATHVSTAKAMLHTEISSVAPHEFECALRTDDQLAARVAMAADREFDSLRCRALEAVHNQPTARLASFLVALSRLSAREGRDSRLVPDEIPSEAIAEQLAMSREDLASALLQLEKRELVSPSPAGLHILDLADLERFANAGSLSEAFRAKREESVP